MPITLNLQGIEKASIHVQPYALNELMALLHVIAEPGHHRERTRELAYIDRKLSPALKRDMERYSPMWARFRVRAMMPLSFSPYKELSVEEELQQLASLPVNVFSQMAAEAIAGRRVPLQFLEDLRSNEFLAICRKRSERSITLALRLGNPERFRAEFIDFIDRAFREFFSEIWGRVHAELQAEAAAKKALLNSGKIDRLFASISPSAYYMEETEQLVFEKLQDAVVDVKGRELILAPSYWAAPHLTVKYDRAYRNFELPIVISYPVASATSTVAPSLIDVQQRMQVLSDSSRLQLIRHLVSESCTTTDLAQKSGMTAPQVSRHISKLKEADLVESVRSGKHVKHRLKTELVYQLGIGYLRALTR